MVPGTETCQFPCLLGCQAESLHRSLGLLFTQEYFGGGVQIQPSLLSAATADYSGACRERWRGASQRQTCPGGWSTTHSGETKTTNSTVEGLITQSVEQLPRVSKWFYYTWLYSQVLSSLPTCPEPSFVTSSLARPSSLLLKVWSTGRS